MDLDVSRATTRGAVHLEIDEHVVQALRERLPAVATETVAAVVVEVPSYAGALSGSMGTSIEAAVQMALGGFLKLVSRSRESDPSTPLGPTLEGAYALGRGEARAGRTMDALLAAYRVGARVAWRELAHAAGDAGVGAATMAQFAELVFAYIDELSASSVAGHTDELSTSGRVRDRYLERLGQQLVTGAAPDALVAAAERATWSAPRTLTAVLLPAAQVRGVVAALGSATLQVGEDLPGLEDPGSGQPLSLLLVPDVEGRGRAHLLRVLEGRQAVVGPPRPWTAARSSYLRAVRTAGLGARGRSPTGTPWTASSTWPTWWCPRIRRRSPTCAPGCSGRSRPCVRRPGSGWRRRCGPGCCTRAVATTSPRTCTCTPRPCATGWASSASCTATGSTTRAWSTSWSWPCPGRTKECSEDFFRSC